MKKTQIAEIVTVPNCITSLRIAGTLFLLFITPFSGVFYIIYTVCGVSDILDGWIARATNSSSELGSKLDSVADILFYAVSIIKMLPVLWRVLPVWVWYCVGGTLLLRAAAYIVAAIKFRRFASMHTNLNKVTSGGLFLVPYSLLTPYSAVYCMIVVAIAALSSAQELILHLIRKEYHGNTNALFHKKEA